MKKLLTTLLVFSSLAASYAQTYSRLMASSGYKNAYSPSDSVSYFYSGDRPGKYNKFKNYSNIKSDRQTAYTMLSSYWMESMNILQTFDNNDNLTTYIQLTDYTRDSMVKTEYTYTANNTIKSSTTYNYTNSIWLPKNSYIIDYDASGRPVLQTNYLWNDTTAQWVAGSRTTKTYGSNGLISESLSEYANGKPVTWTIQNKIIYTYSGTLLMLTEYQQYTLGVWSTYNSSRNTYINNLLDSTINTYSFMSGTSTSTTINMKIFHYNSLAFADTVISIGQVSSVSPMTRSRQILEYDAHNNVIASIAQSYFVNVWANNYRTNYTYDSDDNNTRIDQQSWSGSDWFYDPKNSRIDNYYYKTFDPVAVSNANKQVAGLKIYPVPSASGFININADWKQPQPFTVNICDMQGRVIQYWNEQACSNYTHSLSTQGLQAGTYILKLQGTNEVAAKQFIVQ